jgi:hypothetical protein
LSSPYAEDFDPFQEDWEDSFREFEPRVDLTSYLHAKQLGFRLDPGYFRVLHGTRRSGKTEVLCVEAIEVADQFPGETIPWIMPTIGMGRDIVFPKMEELSDKFKLGLHINRGEYKVITPSGGKIQLFGLSTAPEAEKGRGKRFPLVIADEGGAQNQDLLKRALTQTFGPATADFRGIGGRGIVVAGTAGYEPDSYFERLVGGNSHVSRLGASVHFMTIWDNPFFKGREQMILDAYLADNQLQANDPGYRREWLGEFCTDTEGLCYQRWKGNQLPRHLIPAGGYTVMGLDLGHVDPCAWVVIRFVVTEQVVGNKLLAIHHGHIIASYEETGCSVDRMATITRKLTQAYHVGHIAGDSAGAGGPTLIKELATVYGLPIVAVKKVKTKAGRIWMADSMFGAGTLHVHQGCNSVIRQLQTVPWDEKKQNHHKRFPAHSMDAIHYGLTLSRQHMIEHELPAEPGTEAWYKLQEERDEAATIEYSRQRQRAA